MLNIPDTQLQPLAYSIKDASRVSSLSRSRLYELIAAGELQIRKVGKRTLIPVASLRALIEGRSETVDA